jgi:hypothetical protein
MQAGSLAELVRMTAKLEPRLQASGLERSATPAGL